MLPVVLEIRPATRKDHEAIWQMLRKIAAAGDTYTFDPSITREDALAYWLAEKTHAWVAQSGSRIGRDLSFEGEPARRRFARR